MSIAVKIRVNLQKLDEHFATKRDLIIKFANRRKLIFWYARSRVQGCYTISNYLL